MGRRHVVDWLVMAAMWMGMNGAAQAAIEQPHVLGSTRKSTAMDQYIARAEKVITAVRSMKDEGAADELASLIDDPLFDMLTKPGQRVLLSTAGLVAWRHDEPVNARNHLLRATRIDGNEPDDWYWLATLELQLGDRMRSAQYLTALLRRWPQLADNLDRQFLFDHVYRGERDAARVAVLQALYDANWTNGQRGGDDVWRELALALIEGNKLPEAAEVVARINNPLTIVKLRSDKRFDALAESLARLPSVEAAAARHVDALRKMVDEAPLRIDLAVDLGSALLIAGRDEEALAQSNATLAAIEAGRDTMQFEHLDEQVWVMNNRAIALRRLGRVDDAVAELDRASRLNEGGGDNVSQVLNLGEFYCLLSRPEDALRTIEHTGPLSAYGRMVRGSVLLCVALQTGDRDRAATAMSYLLEHRDDGKGVVLDALLRAGRLDEASTELIRQLETPANRDSALEFVQEFRTAPLLPGSREYDRNWRALLSRPEVQAAVARFGHMGKYDIYDLGAIE